MYDEKTVKMGRINYLDVARGLAIILVVLGHIDFGDNYLCKWIYSFHMPLFFIISGYLRNFKKDRTLNILDEIKHNVKRFLYPYITFSIASILIKFIIVFILHKDNINEFYQMIKLTVALFGYGTLWFLPTIFLADILFLFIHKQRNYRLIFIFILLLSIALTYGIEYASNKYSLDILYGISYFIDRILIGTCYIYIGYILCIVINKMQLRYKNIFMCISIFLCNILISQMNGLVDLHYAKLNNQILYYYLAISTSFSILYMLKIFNAKSQVLEYFGKSSLIIMATHYNFELVRMCQYIYRYLHINMNRYLIDIFFCVVVMIGECVIIYCVNKYFSILINPKKLHQQMICLTKEG